MKTDFYSKPVYGDNDKYVKTKIKIYSGSTVGNFQGKKMPKEKYGAYVMRVFININTRFCYQSKEKVLSSSTFRSMNQKR